MRSGNDARAGSDDDALSESSFDALFLRYYSDVYRLVFRITGSTEDAEDVSQEAFVRLYRQKLDPAKGHNVRAWLFRVASNLAYNLLRDRARSAKRDQKAYTLDTASAENPIDPAVALERQSDAHRVRRALGVLPARQSRLLLLRYGGLSYREVAEVLGVSPGSVGTMLTRAEMAFESAYRGTGHEEEGRVSHEL